MLISNDEIRRCFLHENGLEAEESLLTWNGSLQPDTRDPPHQRSLVRERCADARTSERSI